MARVLKPDKVYFRNAHIRETFGIDINLDPGMRSEFHGQHGPSYSLSIDMASARRSFDDSVSGYILIRRLARFVPTPCMMPILKSD